MPCQVSGKIPPPSQSLLCQAMTAACSSSLSLKATRLAKVLGTRSNHTSQDNAMAFQELSKPLGSWFSKQPRIPLDPCLPRCCPKRSFEDALVQTFFDSMTRSCVTRVKLDRHSLHCWKPRPSSCSRMLLHAFAICAAFCFNHSTTPVRGCRYSTLSIDHVSEKW